MEKKKNHIQRLVPFILLGCVILYLIVASLFEGISSYTSAPFMILWSLLGATSIAFIFKKRLWYRRAVFAIHAAFFFILVGALVTHLTGFSGQMHLREGEISDQLLSEESESPNTLPFSIRLERFTIITYPGTDTPADFQSEITLIDKEGETQTTISMNKIAKKEGYRLFQQSYDPDGKGSVLMVSYDQWGVRITYLGYLLLLIGMLLSLFDSQSNFRKALKSDVLKSGMFVLLICLLPSHSISAKSKTLSPQEAEAFGEILVQYQDRITTLSCLATDFTKKITGKDHYEEYSATQVLAGWLFSREEWQFENMFKVKGKEERQMIGAQSDKVRFVDFFEANGDYKLRKHYLSMGQKDLNAPGMKHLKRLDEKVELIHMLQSGAMLTIFPAQGEHGTQLFSPRNYPHQTFSSEDSLIINHFLPLLYESYSQGEDCTNWIKGFIKFQREKLGENAPSHWTTQAEQLYLGIDKIPLCSYVLLFLGILSLVSLFLKKGAGKIQQIGLAGLLLLWIYLTVIIILRCVVSHRLPLSNGHETLLCIAWMAQTFALTMRRKWNIVLQLGLLASGFALLTASLSDKDPQITPLMPVLNSPLLSIHVSLMMIAYTLLFFVTLSSFIALLSYWVSKDKRRLEHHQTLNTVILYPAIFCLTIGIFLGAIWANVSWGSYWSWDPKETWALISLLVYSFNFHTRSLPLFQKTIIHHLYQIIAFLFILITYFGVNYLFGGMHSYAG